jgi:hypothetical protein
LTPFGGRRRVRLNRLGPGIGFEEKADLARLFRTLLDD